jgi:hypothetical protein
MDAKVRGSLIKALRDLELERANVDRQIAAVQSVLGTVDGLKRRAGSPAGGAKRRAMSTKARKLISARMKAVWAKRRAQKKTQAAKPEAKRA